ncbi:hypothetical protein PIB30_073979 [Stylosanthes scabra]|uniref:Putative plant transposon protein domain-containing protein n=1 Tax=Stylosanthes scabra TaxID=79078 RepID=A0ABU6ZN67_9FABA|nr:hypothetical protein [Stylosanthes scabra]
MASSSAPVTIFDEHHFRKEFNQQLFESHVRRKKVILEVGFNLDVGEYPQIMEQIMLRGVSQLLALMHSVSRNSTLMQQFRMRRRQMKMSSLTRVPIQLRRPELHPFAKGWQEFIIHLLVPTGNKSEITIARAILIHSIMRGEEVRAEDMIVDNMAVIAQGLQSKGNLGFPSTIYELREFRRTSKIPEEKYITAKRMESTRIPRNLPQQQQGDNDEDEPMPQAG